MIIKIQQLEKVENRLYSNVKYVSDFFPLFQQKQPHVAVT